MFKCIKEVVVNDGRVICFQKGAVYDSQYFNDITGYELIDDTGTPHIIGHEGDGWFDEHFVDAVEDTKDEEYYNLMVEGYSEMPNHDAIETKALQESIKKQIEFAVSPYKAFYDYFFELYGQGLEIANWHQNGELEPFDVLFESAWIGLDNSGD